MSWFTPKAEPKPITIVELEKLTPIEETPDSVAAVASLRSHHGFQWLVKKLKLQAARLKAELENTKQTSIEDYYFLQTGLHWCRWLQQQVDIANDKYLSMRPANPQERMHIEDIERVIELVGNSDTI